MTPCQPALMKLRLQMVYYQHWRIQELITTSSLPAQVSWNASVNFWHSRILFTVPVESMESSLEDVYLNFIPLTFFGWILILCFLSLCYIHLYSMRSVLLSICFPDQYLDDAVIAHETWHKPRELYKNQKTNLYVSSLGSGLTMPVVFQDFLFQLP